MIINITKDHLNKGESLHTELCPIALALQEAVPVRYVRVTQESIHLHEDGKKLVKVPDHLYRNDARLRAWLENLDMGMNRQPISVELREDKARIIPDQQEAQSSALEDGLPAQRPLPTSRGNPRPMTKAAAQTRSA